MGRKLGIGLLVVLVLAAIATVVVLKTGVFGRSGKDSDAQSYATLTHTGAELTAAKSAQVEVTGSLRAVVGSTATTWSGTTKIGFGGDPSWTASYDKVASAGQPVFQEEVRHAGRQTVLKSDAFVVPDKKSWIDPKVSILILPNPLSNTELGITDFTLWQGMLDSLTRSGTEEASTDELPDVVGASHEYKILCSTTAGTCPPPFGRTIDNYFNGVGFQPRLSAWYDDKGLIRRLDVRGSVIWNPVAGEPPGQSHPQGEFLFEASFLLSDFGTPVTVTTPPANQISGSKLVQLKK